MQEREGPLHILLSLLILFGIIAWSLHGLSKDFESPRTVLPDKVRQGLHEFKGRTGLKRGEDFQSISGVRMLWYPEGIVRGWDEEGKGRIKRIEEGFWLSKSPLKHEQYRFVWDGGESAYLGDEEVVEWLTDAQERYYAKLLNECEQRLGRIPGYRIEPAKLNELLYAMNKDRHLGKTVFWKGMIKNQDGIRQQGDRFRERIKELSKRYCYLAMVPVQEKSSSNENTLSQGLIFWGALLALPASFVVYCLMTLRARQLNKVFSAFAHLYKGELIKTAGISGYPKVSFPYRGIPVTLEFFPSGPPQNEVFTCLRFALKGAFKGPLLRLEIAPLSLKSFRQVKLWGMQSHQDHGADSSLSPVDIQTDDLELLQQVMKRGLEEKIRKLDICGGLSPTYLSLNSDRLVAKKMKFICRLSELRDYALRVFEFLDVIIEHYEMLLSSEEFLVIEDARVKGAVRTRLCQICGTEIEDRAVACDKCETLHHRDCWDYNGVCATFACGCESSHSVDLS